jgi:hypothetical protein
MNKIFKLKQTKWIKKLKIKTNRIDIQRISTIKKGNPKMKNQ